MLRGETPVAAAASTGAPLRVGAGEVQRIDRKAVMFEKSDLDELVSADAAPAVSLYLPTHTAGREIRQDPLRLRNLLDSAAQQLAEGRRKPEIEELLAPGRALLEDDDFWRHQQEGLGVFIAPAFCRVHRLPIAVPEESVVDRYFYIRPLLPLTEDGTEFWLLSISLARTRLYRGSPRGLAEPKDVALPSGIGLVRRETEYQETHHAPGPRRHTAHAKGQVRGDAPDELRKAELIELLRRVAAAVEPLIKRAPAPLLLAAGPEIGGNFRNIAPWPELEAEGIQENPDALGEAELHRRAQQIMAPKAKAARAVALGRLYSLLQPGTGQATAVPQEIVEAAHYGRVDTLFLAAEARLWGRFDESSQRALVHATPVQGDGDLLNFAALMTLRQGGAVITVAADELPAPHLGAAILRY